MDLAWWQWALAAAVVTIGWPFVVYFTANFWGAGVMAGEAKYLAALRKFA